MPWRPEGAPPPLWVSAARAMDDLVMHAPWRGANFGCADPAGPALRCSPAPPQLHVFPSPSGPIVPSGDHAPESLLRWNTGSPVLDEEGPAPARGSWRSRRTEAA